MKLEQGACGHEVAGRIQEHGIKWQTTREQVDQRAAGEPDPLPASSADVAAPRQEPPEEPQMQPQ